MALRLSASDGPGFVEMDPKTFGRLLYLARLQGWEPEKLPPSWPANTWNTEIVLRDIDGYSSGCVSKRDADGLRRALSRLLERGRVSFDKELYQAASKVVEKLGANGFRVQPEADADAATSQVVPIVAEERVPVLPSDDVPEQPAPSETRRWSRPQGTEAELLREGWVSDPRLPVYDRVIF